MTLAYDLDPATGALSGERELVRDGQGAGGGQVHRLDPEGRLVARVEIGVDGPPVRPLRGLLPG